MTGRQRELRPNAQGYFRPYLGFYVTNGHRQPKRFTLGKDRSEAQRRFARLMLLYDDDQRAPSPNDGNMSGCWSPQALELAEAIETGKAKELPIGCLVSVPPPPSIDRRAIGEYQQRIAHEQARFPSLTFTPSAPAVYTESQTVNRQYVSQRMAELQRELEDMGALLQGQTIKTLVGTTLGQALERWGGTILNKAKYRTPEGTPNPTGKKVLDQHKSLSFYLAEWLTLDLGMIGKAECEAMIDRLASRPKTQRDDYLSRSGARNLIWTTRTFLKWIEDEPSINWELPPKFNLAQRVQYRQDNLEEAKSRPNELVTIPIEHLKILAQHATEKEKRYMGLALNCAYGSDQVGRLQVEWLDLEAQRVDGVRLKRVTASRHYLWKCNCTRLADAIGKRTAGTIFVGPDGQPLYRTSKKGNVVDKIGASWEKLVARVIKIDPTFPKYSFGKVRKTAATLTLQVADPHIASMLLAHKTISDDELLTAYANLPWAKLYEVQRQLEATIVPQIGL